jgi:hypothetical protein
MPSADRKERNRVYQQAFRARQSMRVKELEERIGPEPDTNSKKAELESSNATLREDLLKCYKKIQSFHITAKSLATTLAVILGIKVAVSLNFQLQLQKNSCDYF